MNNGISIEEARKMGLLPKRAESLKPLTAEQLRKAGSAEAAVRIQTALDAKAKREKATHREHCDKCTINVIGKLIDLNRYARNRGDRIRGSDATKELFKEAWRRAGCPVIGAEFKVHWHLISSSRKKDPSNMVDGAKKACLDAAVDVGVVPNDNWRWHIGPDVESWEHDPKRDMFCITIEAIAPAKSF